MPTIVNYILQLHILLNFIYIGFVDLLHVIDQHKYLLGQQCYAINFIFKLLLAMYYDIMIQISSVTHVIVLTCMGMRDLPDMYA